MVDILSAQSGVMDTKTGDAEMKDLEDLEEGELPEEGEIDDDDEGAETSVPAAPPASTGSSRRPSNSPGRGSPDKGRRNGGSFLSDSSRFTPRLNKSSRSKRTDPKPSSEKTEPKVSTSPPAKISDDPFGPSDSDYREEDRDYRNYGEEDFGDTDYRTADKRRRRSQSPQSAIGEWGARPFKRMRGGFAPRGRFAGRETSHIICKFYREGFCRDGDTCLFSHSAEDSLRLPELCKFYKQGYCKKGLHCSNLHGEFPCIGYHRGDCRGECGFSHHPLNDYTRPIFEKYNAIYYGDDFRPGDAPPPQATVPTRLADQTTVPRLPPGLTMPPGFPGGPPAGAPPIMPPPPNMVLRTASPPPSMIGNNSTLPPVPRRRPLLPQPTEEPRDPHTGLPPPSVVHPQLSSVRTGYSPPPQIHPVGGYSSPFRPSPPRREEPPIQAPAPAFDINNMLAQFSAASSSRDSPASPPQQPTRPRADSLGQAVWRLLEVLRSPAYSTVDPQVASTCGPADPRMTKVLDSQFDAVTSLISSNAPGAQSSSNPFPPPSLVDPRSLSDPRLRSRPASLADPRSATTRSSWMPQMPQSSL